MIDSKRIFPVRIYWIISIEMLFFLGGCGLHRILPVTQPDINQATPTPLYSVEQLLQEGITFHPGIEQMIYSLTNQERGIHGIHHQGQLRLYHPDDQLHQIARKHAADMLVKNYFDHVNPDGLSPNDRILLYHRSLITIKTGENICRQTMGYKFITHHLANDIVTSWMASPNHRTNVLSDQFTHIGVGVAVKDDLVIAVQDFASVVAYVTPPVPLELHRGTSLDINIQEKTGPIGRLDKFDFWSCATQQPVGVTASIKSGKIKSPPGVYRIRFHFRSATENLWEIYQGPIVQIDQNESIKQICPVQTTGGAD